MRKFIGAWAAVMLLVAACSTADSGDNTPPPSTLTTTSSTTAPAPTSTTTTVREPSGPGHGGVAVVAELEYPTTLNPFAPDEGFLITTIIGQAWMTGGLGHRRRDSRADPGGRGRAADGVQRWRGRRRGRIDDGDVRDPGRGGVVGRCSDLG